MFTKSSLIITLALLVVAEGVAANINFKACLQSIQSGTHGNTIGVDAYGQPVNNVSLAKGVNYTTCLHVCGHGNEAFDWTIFSQQFNSWFIPWLALASQLPVGAESRLDNVVSVLLAIGSPALATYSLVITILNNRWLDKYLADMRYPNTKNVASVLFALQHVPFQLITDGPLLPSLVVLPQNDRWWSEMAKQTEQTRNWNMPAAMNIAWVFIALIFTVADSNDDMTFVYSNGHGVAAVWMWLLPIVIGWLWVGSQTESNHLRKALWYCNGDLAYVATEEGPQRAGKFSERRAIDHGSGTDTSRVWHDELREAPIFNYARILFWTQATEHIVTLYKVSSVMAANHITVDGRQWVDSNDGRHVICEDNRIGDVGQVIRYCHPHYPSTEERDKLSELEMPVISPRWNLGVLGRMSAAIISALFLQWSTTGAAVLIPILTPTIGLGCRSMVFLVYGAVATISFFSFIVSSMLAHACRPSDVGNLTNQNQSIVIRSFAIGFRWMGKTLATINSIAIVIGCTFQFSNVYSSCYCISSVLGLGTAKGFALLLTGSDLISMGVRDMWLAGIAWALGASILFGTFVYVAASPRRHCVLH